MQTISERDKKILKIGGIAVVIILLWFAVASPWLDDWARVRNELTAERAKLAKLSGLTEDKASAAKLDGLFSKVPVFEMPQKKELQGPLFRDKVNEQLKKSGIKVTSLILQKEMTVKTIPGYKVCPLHCEGKCNFNQVLDLLASLNENPYLLGIDELRLTTDPKDKKNMELKLVVSTLVKIN